MSVKSNTASNIFKSLITLQCPLTIRRKLKSTKVKGKEKKEEEGQKELTEEEKAALYSVPDKKTKGKEVSVKTLSIIYPCSRYINKGYEEEREKG